MNTKIRVLLVDDHPVVLEGAGALLAPYRHIEIVGKATDGLDAIHKCKTLQPDVTLMSARISGMNGLEATRRLAREVPKTKVLIFSRLKESQLMPALVESGAKGFVSKTQSGPQLARAIEAVHSGRNVFNAEPVNERGEGSAIFQHRTGHQNKNPFTPRQREVLALIAEGCSSKQVADLLGLSVRTVEKHRERMMAKVGTYSITRVIRDAVTNDWITLDRATPVRVGT